MYRNEGKSYGVNLRHLFVNFNFPQTFFELFALVFYIPLFNSNATSVWSTADNACRFFPILSRMLFMNSILRRVAALFCLGLPLAPSSSVSQQDTVSLEQAIQLARKNHGSIRIAELSVQQSESRTRELQSSRLPTFLFHSHYLYTPEGGYDEVVTNGGEYASQLTARVNVFDGPRNSLIDQSAVLEEQARTLLQKSESDIAFSVRSIYYECQRAAEEIRIRRETVNRLEDYQQLLEQLRLGGHASDSDVLKAQVELNNARIELDQASGELEKSIVSLKTITALPFDRAIFISSQTEPVPDTTASFASLPPDNNIDLQMLSQEKRSSEFDIQAARAERLPLVTLSGDVGALGVKPKDFHENLGYSALVSVEIPLFDWGGIGKRVEQKELSQSQIETQLQVRRREVESEWKITALDLQRNGRNLLQYKENIVEAEKNYLTAKSRLAGGAGSNLDVLDSQRLLNDVKLNYNTTLFQVEMDRATLLHLKGE